MNRTPITSFRPDRDNHASRFRSTAAVLCLTALLGASLQGCVGAVIGAGATVGTAAMEERGIAGVTDDAALRIRLNGLFSGKDERLWRKVGLQVYMGRVLLTGAVETEDMRAEAVRLAWSAEGVKEVINEMQIAQSGGATGFARDTWITTQLKSALLFDKDVSSINYSVESVGGTVYLIGLAQDRAELNRVMNHARGMSYVKKVVNYVQIKRPPSNP
ncbi:MAG: BON domain-containing protein [Rhodospirillaceae bacterium]|nr:BON domain-containing protein [Rhodospirillaceae bacterium]